MIAKSLDAVRPFTSTTRASSTPAGPTIDRPGSTTIGRRVVPDLVDEGRRVPVGRRDGSAVVGDAEAAARVEVLERDARLLRLTREAGEPRRGRPHAGRAW